MRSGQFCNAPLAPGHSWRTFLLRNAVPFSPTICDTTGKGFLSWVCDEITNWFYRWDFSTFSKVVTLVCSFIFTFVVNCFSSNNNFVWVISGKQIICAQNRLFTRSRGQSPRPLMNSINMIYLPRKPGHLSGKKKNADSLKKSVFWFF